MPKNKKIIIIGALAAGMAFAARMRRLDEKSEITIFEKGSEASSAVCKFPYFLEGIVAKEDLAKFSPATFLAWFNIKINLKSELISIDYKNKEIQIKNLDTNLITNYPYDELILATGTSPKIITDFASDKIYYLKTIEEIINLKAKLSTAKKITILGAGNIGIEITEGLLNKGFDLTLIEKTPYLLNHLNHEISISLKGYLEKLGVKVYTNQNDINITPDEIKLACENIKYDLLIIAVGTNYNNQYLANLPVNLYQGAIKVSKNYLTGIKNVYAIGDIATKNSIDNKITTFGNAQAAAMQARELADIIAGVGEYKNNSTFPIILKVGAKNIAYLGRKNHDDILITIHNNLDELGKTYSLIKFYFNKKTHQITCCETYGNGNNVMLINIISLIMQMGNNLAKITNLSFAYAPPFELSKGAINIILGIANNIIKGLHERVYYEDLKSDDFILDVREQEELKDASLDNALNIPLGDLRANLSKLPKNKVINILCQVGKRAYFAERILKQNNFKCAVIDGGIATILKRSDKNGFSK